MARPPLLCKEGNTRNNNPFTTLRIRKSVKTNPVRLEIFKSLFHAIAEEMGATLKRTAFSPNIKERRDYSCAAFDHHWDMLPQRGHMSVHPGSMPLFLKAALHNRNISPRATA